MVDPLHSFLSRFRTRLYDRVEYSFDDGWNDVGIMIGGEGRHFIDDVVRFLEGLPFADELSRTAAHVHRSAHPVRYLFRVDSDRRLIHTVSLYLRLPDEAPDTLTEALKAISPLSWDGPNLLELAAVLESPPEGIGLRTGIDGRTGVAAYFRVNRPLPAFRVKTVGKLTQACGFPATIADQINADTPLLYDRAHVGVVGLDGGTGGAVRNLKLDPANVSFSMAHEFLRRKGASRARLDALASFGRALGRTRLSYMGLKYDEGGFAGWRMYWSMRPHASRSVCSPVMAIDNPMFSPVFEHVRPGRT